MTDLRFVQMRLVLDFHSAVGVRKIMKYFVVNHLFPITTPQQTAGNLIRGDYKSTS